MSKPTVQGSIAHTPVLRQSVQIFLALKPGACVVDATFGLGGHTRDMIQALANTGHIYAFDQDFENIEIGSELLKPYRSQITIVHDNFENLADRLQKYGVTTIDAILFDLGVASSHFDIATRGFSFQSDGPLDMRFDPGSISQTAADLLRSLDGKELTTLFHQYGEEKHAAKIARAIVEDRKHAPFKTTQQLSQLIVRLYPPQERYKKIHPATRVFQALRIAVNRELDVLEKVLPQAVSLLRPGGHLVVISYHSLEDRIVKHFLRSQAQSCICPQEIMYCQCRGRPVLKILTKKPVVPTDQEIAENPRSRSAKLRCAEKL